MQLVQHGQIVGLGTPSPRLSLLGGHNIHLLSLLLDGSLKERSEVADGIQASGQESAKNDGEPVSTDPVALSKGHVKSVKGQSRQSWTG